eukprot:TRINITY_DN2453_c0_g1_i2.p1 TRINITY_DN2453_c0_g1~~TRINITY_DN2453_c0_g1_i2.p1  ORF type:complete len:634 (+),score=101.04 TRINITY_DN2453_c0_g1_i2:87-1904(+)
MSAEDLVAKLTTISIEEDDKPLLESATLEALIPHLASGKFTNIVVMAGAGISTAAGIPDFRTPGTGLYDNLQKYDLPHPTAIFEIGYFKTNPRPFFTLAKELYPGNFDPTTTHYFVRLLEQKGLLLRCYTQNIDTLERVAGIAPDKLVEAHGCFATAHCIVCSKEYEADAIRAEVFAEKVPTCECGGTIKPDIVFFGEQLPQRFHALVKKDLAAADLLIIMGTSLQVHPFASLVNMVGDKCVRLLINRERVGHIGPERAKLEKAINASFDGLRFCCEDNTRDIDLLGDVQDCVRLLTQQCGWESELNTLIAEHKAFRDQATTAPPAAVATTTTTPDAAPAPAPTQAVAADEPVIDERVLREAMAAGYDAFDLSSGTGVNLKRDCPHVDGRNIGPLPTRPLFYGQCCSVCEDASEMWLCLRCYGGFCSRYVAGHMGEHHTQCQHDIAASWSDLSVWCYCCEEYISSPDLLPQLDAMHRAKFGQAHPFARRFHDTAVVADTTVREYNLDAPSPQVKGVGVVPKMQCPHLAHMIAPWPADFRPAAGCVQCNDTTENWVCVMCYQTLCSRYVNKHMGLHANAVGHCLAVSQSDNSVWCFECDSYVTNPV